MASAKNNRPTGDFKNFLAANKNNTRVLGALERHIIAMPEDTSRRTDVLHPSAMVKDDWCHRGSYFQLLGFPPPPSKYAKSMRQYMVFETGHAIHARWQNLFRDMGKLWGKYKCLECDQIFTGLPSDHDSKLGPEAYEYREVSLTYEPLRIAGHSDGLLVGLGEPLMLEIKSIGPGTFRYEAPHMTYSTNGHLDQMWKALDAPFQTHVAQVQIYMRLAELLELEYQPQEAVMFYENKATQETKEFVVPKSMFGIKHLFDAAEMICASVDAKTPPPCNIAGQEGCQQCKGYANV